MTAAYAEELGWFEHANERVLGILIRDRTDEDYAGIVLARDELLQYRWTTMTEFAPSARWAKACLRRVLEQAAMAPDEVHHQGHRRRAPVDFFKPVVPSDRLDVDFRRLVEQEGFSPARGIIEPMMRWYEDVDGNFVQQFQTTGFDARLWELYLFATLVELGFMFDRTESTPDFVVSGLRGKIAIEAVTVNPTKDDKGAKVSLPSVESKEDRLAFLRNYMPIKFGSALYSKLVKEYWTKERIRGMPFALAIQDFSAPGSMVFTRSALQIYLYGYYHDWVRDETGRLIITPHRIATHKWGSKQIPSGFFFLPGAENISAVLFSSSGTISKFNRMGLLARFGSSRIQMFRIGYAFDPDPDAAAPKPFKLDVSAPGYKETWVEGLDVFHNPRALAPLDPGLIPGAAHLRLTDEGQIAAVMPDWHPFGSRTLIGTPKEEEAGTAAA